MSLVCARWIRRPGMTWFSTSYVHTSRRFSGWTGPLNLVSAGKHPVRCDNLTRTLSFPLHLFCPRIAGAASDSPAALRPDVQVSITRRRTAGGWRAKLAGTGVRSEPRRTERGIGLPKGGGPFKGFAFVVLRNAEDVDRALSTYPWQGEPKTREAQRDPDDADDEADAHMEEGRDEPDPKGKGKAKKAKPSPAEKSRNAGLRALK